jgi:hypothetical protein
MSEMVGAFCLLPFPPRFLDNQVVRDESTKMLTVFP